MKWASIRLFFKKLYFSCFSYGHVCKNCQQRLKLNTGDLDSPSSQLLDSDVETENAEVGECTLVRLSNGSHLYGSQESLRSLCNPSNESVSECPSISLLSELDAQYKALISKYESLVSTQMAEFANSPVDDSQATTKLNDVDSGNENRVPDQKTTITETVNVCGPNSSLQVQLNGPPRTLNLNSTGNQIQCHFQRSPPEYKRLFQEIFAVLKKTIDIDDAEKKAMKAVPVKKKVAEPKEVVQCSFGHGAYVTNGKTYAQVVQSGKPRRRGFSRPPRCCYNTNRSYYQN